MVNNKNIQIMTNQENTQNFSFIERLKNSFSVSKKHSNKRQIYNSLWALFFGFIISCFIIAFSKNNPFLVFGSLFNNGLSVYSNQFISLFCSYIIGGIAIAICFKMNVFNIGISGQMMLAGFTTLLIFRAQLLDSTSISGPSILLAFFISMFSGAFLAFIAGALKTYLKINEVVSTIMLNWIVFFIIQYFVHSYASIGDKPFLATNDSLSSNLSVGYITGLPSLFFATDINNSWYTVGWNWIIITIALVFVVGVAIIFWKTSIGYKIKVCGLNPDAAAYAGINQKFMSLIVISISGAMAGIAGFVYYIGIGGNINIGSEPLTKGFDAIAISLLAFNNPLAICVSSFLYGAISTGSIALPSEFNKMSTEMSQIIVGILLYLAAVAVIFNRLTPVKSFKNIFILYKDKTYVKKWQLFWKQWFIYVFGQPKIMLQIFKVKVKNKKIWKEINQKYKLEYKALEKKLTSPPNNHFDLESLSEEKKFYYFDQIANLSKRKKEELSQYSYFEHFAIKANFKNKYINAKNEWLNRKEFVLRRHIELKQERKIAKINQKLKGGKI